MDYRDKVILAPMVRVSTLPVRLLSLQYGADIVFTEELIDWKLLASVRRWNEKLGTVDYVDPADGTITLRTCEEEKPHVVLQMGTCDAERALMVAQKYANDIAGIDINMGCPKEFSIKGGMGAALLQQPEKVKNILTTLVSGVNIPVTCKIRLLPSEEQTLAFCRMVESCGAAAITVHGRTRQERPRHPVHEDAIRRVAQELTIPVIANGGSRHIRCRAEAEQFRRRCGAAGVMLARTAMWNMSVFRPDGPIPLDDVITRLLQLCVRYDHPFTQAKYTVQQMLRELQETPRGKRFLAAQTLEEICAIWGLDGACRSALGPPASPDSRPLSKRPRLEDGIVAGHAPFVRGHYRPEQLPKTLLHDWCSRRGQPVPSYRLDFSDKLFRAICTVDGRQYASLWEKNKKFAEQGAALTCVAYLNIAREPTTGTTASGPGPAGEPPDMSETTGQPDVPGIAGQPSENGKSSSETNGRVREISEQGPQTNGVKPETLRHTEAKCVTPDVGGLKAETNGMAPEAGQRASESDGPDVGERAVRGETQSSAAEVRTDAAPGSEQDALPGKPSPAGAEACPPGPGGGAAQSEAPTVTDRTAGQMDRTVGQQTVSAAPVS